MGADARWVCHTCKTVCSGAGRPLVKYDAVVTQDNIPLIKKNIRAVALYMELGDLEEKFIGFLDNLNKWLSRHNGHKIHIGSDYSTDMMDLDDYRNETIDGKVSKVTRDEARQRGVEAFEASSIEEIKEIIRRYGEDIESAARELYNRLSIRYL